MTDNQNCTFGDCLKIAWVISGTSKLCFSHYREQNPKNERPAFIESENQVKKVVEYMKNLKLKIAAAQASLTFQYSKGLTSIKHSRDKAKQLLDSQIDRIIKFYQLFFEKDCQRYEFLITEGIELFEGENNIENVLKKATNLFIEVINDSGQYFQVLTDFKNLISRLSDREAEEEKFNNELKLWANSFFEKISGSEEEKPDMIRDLEPIKELVGSYAKNISDKKYLYQLLIKLENKLSEAYQEIELNKKLYKEERGKRELLQQQAVLEKEKPKIFPLEVSIEELKSKIQKLEEKLEEKELENRLKVSENAEVKLEFKATIDFKDSEISSLRTQVKELEIKQEELRLLNSRLEAEKIDLVKKLLETQANAEFKNHRIQKVSEEIRFELILGVKGILESLEKSKELLDKQLSSFIQLEQNFNAKVAIIKQKTKIESLHRSQLEEYIRDLDSSQKEIAALRLEVKELTLGKLNADFQIEKCQIELSEKENHLRSFKDKYYSKINDFIRLEQENGLSINEQKVNAIKKEQEIRSLKENITINLNKIKNLELSLSMSQRKTKELNESEIKKDAEILYLKRKINSQIFALNQENCNINPTLNIAYSVPTLPNLASTRKPPPQLHFLSPEVADNNLINKIKRLENHIEDLKSEIQDSKILNKMVCDLLGMNINTDVESIAMTLIDKLKIAEEQVINSYMDILRIEREQEIEFGKKTAIIGRKISEILQAYDSLTLIKLDYENQLKELDIELTASNEELKAKTEDLINIKTEYEQLLEELNALKIEKEKNDSQLANMKKLNQESMQMQPEKDFLSQINKSLTEKLEAKSLQLESYLNQASSEANYESLGNDSQKIQESIEHLKIEFVELDKGISQAIQVCRKQIASPLLAES